MAPRCPLALRLLSSWPCLAPVARRQRRRAAWSPTAVAPAPESPLPGHRGHRQRAGTRGRAARPPVRGASSSSGSSSSSSSTSSSSSSSSSSSTGGQDAGCIPGQIPDSCAASGEVCHGSIIGLGTCGPPEELDPCSTSTGCATSDLSCLEIFAHTGIYVCLRACQSIADCPNPTTTCFDDSSLGEKVCFYNVCGPDWPLPFPPVSGPSYYGSCNAQGTGDGTCLPVESQLGTVGVCLQGGDVVSGGVCSLMRTDGGQGLCPTGTLCGSIGTLNIYSCDPVCAATANGQLDGGGPNCAQGSICASAANLSYDFGACLLDCSATGTCPGSSVCVPLNGQGVCYP